MKLDSFLTIYNTYLLTNYKSTNASASVFNSEIIYTLPIIITCYIQALLSYTKLAIGKT